MFIKTWGCPCKGVAGWGINKRGSGGVVGSVGAVAGAARISRRLGEWTPRSAFTQPMDHVNVWIPRK